RRPRRLRRGAAGTSLGRGGRPLHDDREVDDQPPAGEARRPAGHRHRPPGRLPDLTVPRLPSPTVRLRLTLLYGALFLVSGAALLAITYFFFRRSTGINLIVPNGGHSD